MTRSIVPFALAAALALAGAGARADCTRDADCAADRICVQSECAEPPPAGPAPRRTLLYLDLGLFGGAAALGKGGLGLFDLNLGPVPIMRLGLGVGRTLNDRLALGARIDLGFGTLRHRDLFAFEEHDPGAKITNTAIDIAVLPYLERAPRSGRMRPYVSIGAGFAASLRGQEIAYDDGMDSTRATESDLFAGVVGLGGGLRFPLAERVTLELGLLMLLGVGELSAGTAEDGPQHEEYGTDDIVFYSRADIFVGVTGWI